MSNQHFFNGYLEKDIYVEEPTGFVRKGHEDKVLKLKKALYRLKQAPRAWNSRINEHFKNNGFVKCPYEHALYSKKTKSGDISFVCLYVDDIIFTGSNLILFKEFKDTMIFKFEMTDIGLMSYFLGMEVKQIEEGIFITQKGYVKAVLKCFKMENSKPISTPIEYGLKF